MQQSLIVQRVGALQPLQLETATSSSVRMEPIVILVVGVEHVPIMGVKRVRKTNFIVHWIFLGHISILVSHYNPRKREERWLQNERKCIPASLLLMGLNTKRSRTWWLFVESIP